MHDQSIIIQRRQLTVTHWDRTAIAARISPDQRAADPLADGHGRPTMDEAVFLEAWEQGLVSWPGAFLRVRQLLRANPGLAEIIRPRRADGVSRTAAH